MGNPVEEFSIIDIPAEVAEHIDELREAELFLKDHNAVGVLIGGKAHGFLTGAHPLEIEKRKDTDLLVIQGGHSLDHQTPYDTFLPAEDGTFRNRNDFVLPYHIHHIGEPLKAGLYLPPPQVIFLTETEMATQRAVDRVIPGIINLRFASETVPFPQLLLDKVVLEFPGDFSWFGEAKFSFPLQIYTREEANGGGRRTFLSFRWRSESEFPCSAFPTSKDVSAPDPFDASFKAYPEVDLSSKEMIEIAEKQIEAGFVREGLDFLLKNRPHLADRCDLLDQILYHASTYPLQCASAIGEWIRVGIERNFATLFIMIMGDDVGFAINKPGYRDDDPIGSLTKKINKIGDNLLERYGARFQELAIKLKGFSFDSLCLDEEKLFAQNKELVKNLLLFMIRTHAYDCISISCEIAYGSSYGILINQYRFMDYSEGEKSLFTQTFFDIAKNCGLTNKEICIELRKQAEGIFTSFFKRPKCHMQYFCDKKLPTGRSKLTVGEFVRKNLSRERRFELCCEAIDKIGFEPFDPEYVRTAEEKPVLESKTLLQLAELLDYTDVAQLMQDIVNALGEEKKQQVNYYFVKASKE